MRRAKADPTDWNDPERRAARMRAIEDERRAERMAEHDRRRRAALDAIVALNGDNRDAVPLSEVVRLLPDNPEWNLYRSGR